MRGRSADVSGGIESPDLARRVKSYNRLYHDTESECYEGIHPEIFDFEARTWRHLIDRARDLLGTSNPRCLDAGSGSGYIPRLFAAAVPASRWVCLDISTAMLKRSRQSLSGVATVAHVGGDCESLPLRAASFDVVTVNSVLHHLPHTEQFLGECRRVLRTGGVLAIAHEPNWRHYRNPMLSVSGRVVSRARRFRRREDGKHRVTRERKEVFHRRLAARIEREGFVDSCEEVSRLVDFHSPTSGGVIDRNRGFRPDRLLDPHEWEKIETQTYAHLGKLSLLPGGRVVKGLEKLLNRWYPDDGYLFWLLARR